MKQGPFVTFREVAQKPDKLTKVWRVVSVQGDTLLGGIKWWPAWRRYCFFPLTDMLFDANCLWDIADFCARMTKEQKENQAKRRVR